MNQNPDLELSNKSIENVIHLFRSIQRTFKETLFEKTKRYGFTGPQMILIHQLLNEPYITLHELSEKMGLSKSTVSGIVDRMVLQGVVIREIPEDNRRIIRLSLSPDFQSNNDLKDLKSKYFTDIFQNANPDDIEVIIRGLEKLYNLMNENRNCTPKNED